MDAAGGGRLAICLLAAAPYGLGAAWAARDVYRWSGVVWGLLVGVMFAAVMLAPLCLVLRWRMSIGPKGLTVFSAWRRRRFHWAHIDSFGVCEVTRATGDGGTDVGGLLVVNTGTGPYSLAVRARDLWAEDQRAARLNAALGLGDTVVSQVRPPRDGARLLPVLGMGAFLVPVVLFGWILAWDQGRNIQACRGGFAAIQSAQEVEHGLAGRYAVSTDQLVRERRLARPRENDRYLLATDGSGSVYVFAPGSAPQRGDNDNPDFCAQIYPGDGGGG